MDLYKRVKALLASPSNSLEFIVIFFSDAENRDKKKNNDYENYCGHI